MQVRSSITKLRIIAFFLFLIPTIALIGSLAFHNYLVSFKFVNDETPNFIENLPGEKVSIECNEQNNFCINIVFEKVNKLTDCSNYIINKITVSESGEVLDVNDK